MNQGQKANLNGKMFHDECWDYLEKKGHNPQVPAGYEALWYGNRLNKTDIFLPDKNAQVECKFQTVSGTCDQKPFAELWNAYERVKCDYYVLLFGGSHWEENTRGMNIFKEAKQMAAKLNSFPRSNGAKKLKVMNSIEFKEWINE